MKSKRQSKIIEIIENNSIETQEELTAKLLEAGFNTTQATISRDIREMKITKSNMETGKQRYILSGNKENDMVDKYKKVLMAGIISLDSSENLIVIKTVSGVAMAVAAALDSLAIDGLMGCIAGDDTIICVVKAKEIAEDVILRIEKLAQ